jgi:acyl carrier protein
MDVEQKLGRVFDPADLDRMRTVDDFVLLMIR